LLKNMQRKMARLELVFWPGVDHRNVGYGELDDRGSIVRFEIIACWAVVRVMSHGLGVLCITPDHEDNEEVNHAAASAMIRACAESALGV
jgi:hypothetical protein